MKDRVTGAEVVTYRWRGVNRRGVSMFGTIGLAPGSVARLVEQYWRLGWREFLVCSGTGPVPPAKDEEFQAGGITRKDGKRIWWAGS